MRTTDYLKAFVALGVILALPGCDDILDVDDPQRFTESDLNQSLEAVANGVEGALHENFDEIVTWDMLLSDVYKDTGTWSQWEEIDRGRFSYGTPSSDTDFQQLMQVRWFADDTRARLIEVLGETEANDTEMMAQVMTIGGVTEMVVGTSYCEAPTEPNGPAMSDVQVLQNALERLDASLAQARAVGSEKWELVSLAARARTHLLLGNYDQAAADAGQIPDGWDYEAVFTTQRQDNSLVNLSTRGFTAAAGLREKWWPRVVDLPGTNHQAILDLWSEAPDPRMPVFFDGTKGVDGVTDHYSQWKHRDFGDNIRILDAEEMRLIEAEALWRDGDLVEAVRIMNQLRDAAGLEPFPETANSELVMEFLLTERFAEQYAEGGTRQADLVRFGVIADFVDRGDFVNTTRPRPIKFPMSDVEARDNTNIVDEEAQRCFPTTS
jgi:hypothetical protein